MGQQIITEVLTNTLAAARELGIEDSLTGEIEAALPKLDSGQHIGPDGRLLEWDQPRKESEPGHRHLSHLYGFHPGISITQEKTPELLAAARKSIDYREQHGSVGVGWSRASGRQYLRPPARRRHRPASPPGNSLHPDPHQWFQLCLRDKAPPFSNRSQFRCHRRSGRDVSPVSRRIDSSASRPARGMARWQRHRLRARGGHTIDLQWKDGNLAGATITKGSGPVLPIFIQGTRVHEDPRVTIK